MKRIKVILSFIVSGSVLRVKMHLKLILYFKSKNFFKIASYFGNRLQRKYGVFISVKTEFDSSLEMRHPIGIVIGEGVRIGKDVIIYQNVTLGGARLGDGKAKNYPSIGEGTVIFAGAVIVGKVSIGKNCTIGANSVVTSDIPDNCTAAGVPARIISRNN